MSLVNEYNFNNKRGGAKKDENEKIWILGSDRCKEYFRRYYHEKNKNKMSQIVICPQCKKEYTHQHKKRHDNSNYHLKRIQVSQ